jgi:hypothetical protein
MIGEAGSISRQLPYFGYENTPKGSREHIP